MPLKIKLKHVRPSSYDWLMKADEERDKHYKYLISE